MHKESVAKIKDLVDDAKHIVIIQADNPDGDSVATSLALEHILGDLNKQITMYCGIDIPKHLRHLPGVDRIQKDLPGSFDLSIIVDTSSKLLLEQLKKNNQLSWVAAKSCIVLDHHSTKSTIDFANVSLITTAVSTGELVYDVCIELGWNINVEAAHLITTSIMADSLGLTTEKTSSHSIRVVADLVDRGVSISKLEEARRLTMRKAPELVHYKGQLLQRIEYYSDDRIAIVSIPWSEIEKFSSLYNPSILVLDDMRLTENTLLAIAFKIYPNGRVTAKIRANLDGAIADKLAEHFGAGGHPAASGFKIEDGRSYEDIKKETIAKATELLDETL